MPRLKPSLFTKVEFDNTEEEQLAATYNDLQRLYFMGMRADLMEQMTQLVLDVNDPKPYAVQKAYIGGQVDLLNSLLQDVN